MVCLTIQIEHHHGGAVHRVQWHGYGELAITLAVAASEGAGRGHYCRVLFNYTNQQRKK